MTKLPENAQKRPKRPKCPNFVQAIPPGGSAARPPPPQRPPSQPRLRHRRSGCDAAAACGHGRGCGCGCGNVSRRRQVYGGAITVHHNLVVSVLTQEKTHGDGHDPNLSFLAPSLTGSSWPLHLKGQRVQRLWFFQNFQISQKLVKN